MIVVEQQLQPLELIQFEKLTRFFMVLFLEHIINLSGYIILPAKNTLGGT